VSYDLRLFAVADGVEAVAAYEQLIRREESDVVNSEDWLKRPLAPPARERMQQLADALRAQWPAFVQFEPRFPLPWIELNDEDRQVQVSVYEDSVALTMPYFRQRIAEMTDCIARCIRVCAESRGYLAYDPQLGSTVTANDGEGISRAYRQMDPALAGIRGEGRARKPWWKFWPR
jgi:hypothetical protein